MSLYEAVITTHVVFECPPEFVNEYVEDLEVNIEEYAPPGQITQVIDSEFTGLPSNLYDSQDETDDELNAILRDLGLTESLPEEDDVYPLQTTPGFYSDTNNFVTGTGQIIGNVHQETEECLNKGCVIHAPSSHSMRDFPTHWRSDRGIMERICEHGIGHPDPDDLNYIARSRGLSVATGEAIHGCDSCCTQ